MIQVILTNPETEPVEETSSWMPRAIGVLLILSAIMLTLCLASYDVHEVGWVFLNPQDAAAAAARPCTNLLGVVGLYVAGLLFYAFGAVAYYLLFLLAMEGLISLFMPQGKRLGPALALLLMFACALAVMDIQPWLLQNWAGGLSLRGAGGALGFLYGTCVLDALMGRTWSLVLLIAVHGGALIYFGRTTPRCVCCEMWHLLCAAGNRVKNWFARRSDKNSTSWKLKPVPLGDPSDGESGAEEEEELPEELKEPDHPRLIDLRHLGGGAVRPEPGRVPTPLRPEPINVRPDGAPPTPPQPTPPRPEREREGGSLSGHMPSEPATDDSMRGGYRRSGDNLDELKGEVEERIERESYNGTLSLRPEPSRPTPPAPRPIPPAPRPTPPRPQPLVRDERMQEADYPLPPYELLSYEPTTDAQNEEVQQEMVEMQQRIIQSLSKFRIPVTEGDITRGPSITRYEFYPPDGMRVNRITNLCNELMLATCSKSINILAPVPGKDTVGIELANTIKTPVYLRELLQDAAFRSPKLRIPVALGKDVYGNTVIGDLAAMPHTLVAGTTGSGKSVCINSMIISMLYKFRPDELKLILVDPKVVEMQPYKRLPHLACPVVTNPGRVISALRWAVNEMEHRYKLFSKIGVRNFTDYNAHACEYTPEEEPLEAEGAPDPRWIEDFASEIERQGEEEIPLSNEEEQAELDFDSGDNIPLRLPYIVIIIDELADLMMMVKEDLETYIARLTQKARAAGIHLVVATQTPRCNVVTGIIKANIPSRIAFKVASPVDSRIILDTPGAENLLGQGDFLFLPPGGITRMTRAQGAFVSDDEVAAVVRHCSHHARQNFDQGVLNEMENGEGSPNADNGGRITGRGGNDEEDELYTRCVQLVVNERKASTSLLQRRFSIGYGRAAKMMDLMEARGVISQPQGNTHAREVLLDAP